MSYVKYSSIEKLSNVVAVVFDCDGVLIDEKTSYDKVIKEVTSVLTEVLTGYKVSADALPSQTIYEIRAVGSFNNDSNTIQLLVEWLSSKIAAEIDRNVGKRLEELAGKTLPELLKVQSTDHIIPEDRISSWLSELERKIALFEGTGAPLEKIEEGLAIHGSLVELMKKVLKPGQKYGMSLLATAFDESFYGSNEIINRRNVGPFFGFEGRLKDEKVIVTNDVIEKLVGRGLKLGICTGRGSWETWKTLGELAKYFDKEACVFITDYVEADPSRSNEFEKPSPWALIKAVRSIEKDGVKLYVGNSVEDYLMYLKARENVGELLFAAVTEKDYRKIDYMLENEVDLVIPSVNHLPKIFELIDEH